MAELPSKNGKRTRVYQFYSLYNVISTIEPVICGQKPEMFIITNIDDVFVIAVYKGTTVRLGLIYIHLPRSLA